MRKGKTDDYNTCACMWPTRRRPISVENLVRLWRSIWLSWLLWYLLSCRGRSLWLTRRYILRWSGSFSTYTDHISYVQKSIIYPSIRGYLTIKSNTRSLSGYAENKAHRVERMTICLADIVQKLPVGAILLKRNTTLYNSCVYISISQIQQWQLK